MEKETPRTRRERVQEDISRRISRFTRPIDSSGSGSTESPAGVTPTSDFGSETEWDDGSWSDLSSEKEEFTGWGVNDRLTEVENDRRDLRGWGVTDRPTRLDSLGFSEYVDVLKAFLTDDNTTAPLTVGVEGEWGTGKSSFMLMLRNRLEDDPDDEHLTVSFEPWRHDGEESIWAAFALEFLRQTRQSLPPHRRWLGDIRLAIRRIKWERGRSGLVVSGLFAIGLIALTAVLVGGTFLLGRAGVLFTTSAAQLQFGDEVAQLVANGGGVTVSSVALFAVWSRVRSRIFDPVRAELDRYISDPGYEERVSFVARFNNDFNHIVGAYCGDEPVFVFIDDLDRCSLPRAAELMGALTLLLESKPELYFVFGMDREKVAAGIASKYDRLYEYLYKVEEEPGSERDLGLRFGYDYLEKFVQVRVRIPQPGPKELDSFLEELVVGRTEPRSDDTPLPESYMETGTEVRPTGTTQSASADIEELKKEVLRDAVTLAAPILEYKPRSIKTFANQYRLDAMLAARQGLFAWEIDGSEPGPEDVTHEHLALWVAAGLAPHDLRARLGPPPTSHSAVAEIYDGDAPDWADDEVNLHILDGGMAPDRAHGVIPEKLARFAPIPDPTDRESPTVVS